MKLFEDAGILERHDFRDGRARYEEIRDHHDHLIDLSTGSVIEFVNEDIERCRRVAEGSASISSTTGWSSTAFPGRSKKPGPPADMRSSSARWNTVVFLIVTLLLSAVARAETACALAADLAACLSPLRLPADGRAHHRARDPGRGGVILTANHTGWIDIPVLSAVTPVSFVAKQEVNLWPFFGTLARLQRTVFVRRERSKALEDRDNIRRRLSDGDALVLFPEGTSGDGNRVLPFKSSLLSAAELALGEGVEGAARHAPVQPVSVTYVGLHGVPMGRENRPLIAWYGDMELVSHLWEARALARSTSWSSCIPR